MECGIYEWNVEFMDGMWNLWMECGIYGWNVECMVECEMHGWNVEFMNGMCNLWMECGIYQSVTWFRDFKTQISVPVFQNETHAFISYTERRTDRQTDFLLIDKTPNSCQGTVRSWRHVYRNGF
jgi:hypothetical protein